MALSIGGDDSVAWSVRHGGKYEIVEDKPKGSLHNSNKADHAVNIIKGEGFVEGRDPRNTAGTFFQVTIEVPDGQRGDDFIDELRAVANKAKPGAKLSFTLPILDSNPTQIEIDWPLVK